LSLQHQHPAVFGIVQIAKYPEIQPVDIGKFTKTENAADGFVINAMQDKLNALH
jgi:hypothetical protein